MNRRFPWLTLGILGVLLFLALGAPLFGMPDPIKMSVVDRFKAPSAAHWLGTDEYGRDELSRLIWGAQTSLFVAFSAALLAGSIGTALGILGGYLRGGVEFATLRLTDILLCFPPLLLALLVVTLFGPGATTLVPVLAIVYIPGFARVAYAGVLTARSQDYVEAVRALGARPARIMWHTILPNVSGPLLVQFSLVIASAIVLESGLSFLGLGVVPPAASWGLMIGSARGTMAQAPILLLWPCLALTLTILAINAFCDNLRDYLSPQAIGRARRGVMEALAPGLLPPPKRTVLAVDGLYVAIDTPFGRVDAIRDLSFSVEAGQTVALVGESGSGKSVTSLAALGLLPSGISARSGAAWVDGQDLLRASPDELRNWRGSKIAMIFQDPMSSLNPVHRIGDQIVEAVRAHRTMTRIDAWDRAVELLKQVGVPDANRRAKAYPHELSGGMRQRVMIAMAMANGPELLIADEPTTALDVTVQAQVLALMQQLQKDKGVALLFISHSLPVVAEIADRVVVLYSGQVVEEGATAEIFAKPLHPYTAALLASASTEDGPPPEGIPGVVPGPRNRPAGCTFGPRCPRHSDVCDLPPPLVEMMAGRKTRCAKWAEL